MQKLCLVVLALSALTLVGCASPKTPSAPISWYKSNARPGEFQQDNYFCLQQSQQPFGSGQVNAYGGRSVNGMTTNDTLLRQCLNAKGWHMDWVDIHEMKAQTEAQKQKNRNDAGQRESNEISELIKAHCAKPELEEFYSKTGCRIRDITFEQLADDTKVTAPQKTALSKDRELSVTIRKMIEDFNIKYSGDLGRRRNNLYRTDSAPKSETNDLDLFTGKITWGQYNKNRKDNAREFEKKNDELKR